MVKHLSALVALFCALGQAQSVKFDGTATLIGTVKVSSEAPPAGGLIQSGLVADWPHLEQANIQDFIDQKGSNNGFLGTSAGDTVEDPTWQPGGGSGNRLDFSAGKRTSIPDTASISPTAAMTFCIVYQRDDTNLKRMLVHRWQTGQRSWNWVLENSAKASIGIAQSLTDPSNPFGTTGVESASVWYHACFVFDGAGAANADRLKFYRNGSQETLTFSGTIPATLTDPSGNMELGNDSIGAFSDFDGRTSYAYMYNRALNATEISTNHTEMISIMSGRGISF